ncbi:MAG: endonuclease/exonuclease/phosphatase family protein [Candidatus Kaiserbacteria bacterium]|nr:MAG: endonuclease/exonuclease/phosphatase family protein [Candidatus Kaiserbacteria bacterium]
MLKLVSLNIELDKHLDTVAAFLAAQKPDVACLQEVFEQDLPRLSEALSAPNYKFVPMNRHTEAQPPKVMGICVLTSLPIVKTNAQLYRGDPRLIPPFDWNDQNTFRFKNQALLMCDIRKDETYRVGTTHFTWTPDSQPDELQHEDIKKLVSMLEQEGEFVVAGDFNAPRGGEIFSELALRYKDNIPAEYKTSIDVSLHRAGKEKARLLETLMVDGLFSTQGYKVSDVKLHFGISDHAAISADLSVAN